MATSKSLDVHLKVFVKGKEDKIFYCFMPISYNDLKSTIQNMLVEDVSKMRIYWIDADGDEIIIDSYMAYNIFIQMAEKKKVFVESEMKEPPHKVSFVPTTDEKPQLNEKREHKDVECDGCGERPIVGFRYKCVQCSNFDLCMKCEGKMMHKQHVMFRLPEPLKRGSRRISLKKYKKEFTRNESDCGDESCNRNDRHRHNRRSSHGGKQNFISHLYTMMHDLAEGIEIPIDEPTMTPENTSTSTEQNQQSNTKNENNTSNNDNKNERAENQPKGINMNFDPNYAKVGIQVMNNISEMFSKMLDPLNIEIDLDVDLNDKNPKKTDKKNKNNETSNDLNRDNKEKQKDSENENLKQNERRDSVDVDTSSSGQVIKDKVIDENNKPTTHEQAEKKRDSVNDEGNDWTLVDKSIEKENTSNYNKNDDGAIGGIDENMIGPTAATAPYIETLETEPKVVDYAKLSKDLLQHLKKEKQPEMRAQIVYHSKPHINNAIIAMTAMGFSNEGNWLTHLLESVDGDISQALDLMKPVK